MRWITTAFESASMEGNVLVVNDASPDDLVLHRVAQALRDDSKLDSIFSGRIDAVPVLDPYDFRTMPRLRVALFTRDPQESPTSLVIDDIHVMVEIRYELTVIRNLDLGQASIGTLYRHIAGVLRHKDNRLLPMEVNGNPRIPLAMEMQLLSLSFRPDRDPETGNVAFNNIMEWSYRVDVDKDTLKIKNVLIAGG